ncbi:MAG: DUF4405 domain-containing protein, partial [Anaerolineae bacterium]|nr:DUF4405 domain-containing protein [Anaerolineae bacterium]
VHEWLSLALAAAVVCHLLLNWNWIVAVTRRFLDSTPWRVRLSAVVNVLLFIDMTILIFSGVLISEVVLPLSGINLPYEPAWRVLHTLSANLSLWLMGVHLALSWSWIVRAFRDIVVRPVAVLFKGTRRINHSTEEVGA